jgi:hypothetical protein
MRFIMRRANTRSRTGPKKHETTAPAAATDPPEPAEAHVMPAHVVLSTLGGAPTSFTLREACHDESRQRTDIKGAIEAEAKGASCPRKRTFPKHANRYYFEC